MIGEAIKYISSQFAFVVQTFFALALFFVALPLFYGDVAILSVPIIDIPVILSEWWFDAFMFWIGQISGAIADRLIDVLPI